GPEATRIRPASGRASLHAATSSAARSLSGCSRSRSETSGPPRARERSGPAGSPRAGLKWDRADESWPSPSGRLLLLSHPAARGSNDELQCRLLRVVIGERGLAGAPHGQGFPISLLGRAD